MRAEQQVQSRQEHPGPTDSPRSLEAPEASERDASPELSLLALRARLIGCLKSRVNEPDWQLLLQQTEYFADVEIHYGYYWRDGFGGVLPGGYDASSVAAEAVAELFTEQPEN